MSLTEVSGSEAWAPLHDGEHHEQQEDDRSDDYRQHRENLPQSIFASLHTPDPRC